MITISPHFDTVFRLPMANWTPLRHRQMPSLILATLSLLLLNGNFFAATTTAQQKPNIIFILVDDQGYYDLGCYGATHQQAVEESREQLAIIEKAQLTEFARLLGDLQHSGEGEQNLLDRTMVLLGSNLGNANNHSNVNLPTLLAGGGFKHGQHLNCDRSGETPLANLYLSMLQRLGLHPDRFSTSTGPLQGLEFVG